MDALTFIAKLIESLAWPTAALVLVLLLRAEIQSLLPFLKKLKAGPVEAEFEREVKELRSETEAEFPPAMGLVASPRQQTLLELAQISPRSAIIEAWQGIEFAAARVVSNRAISVPVKEASSPNAVIRALTKFNLVGQREVSLYYDLRALRNQAVHEEHFAATQEAVFNFVQLATRLQSYFDQLAQNPAVGPQQ